jgi:hypothetical protein
MTTQNAQHTPGPWTVSDWNQAPSTAVIGSDASCIARTFSPLAGTIKDAQANARLIAAAPDLLAALEAHRQVIDSMYEDGLIIQDSMPQAYFQAERNADSAIRRARGED